ncbi:MAG: acetyl-CoA carboxylase biotin carboxyl carrier protein [Phycisphaerae bacterium]|nr:acetyl-CoA carboxylase biotin carboxyl carrier protein [Phycisphaerae bacterium]MDZ4831974.1 acetyl-CoA carboxylase biotin carboxyl carrier protein [Phycisphaerae bacterium]
MIDIRKLKELVRLMVSNDLVELDVRDEQEQVTIKRPNPQSVPMVMHPGPAPVSYPGIGAGTPAGAATLAPAAAPPAASVPSEAGIALESPMVGTFYLAAGPGKPNFVQIGSKVGPDTIVCLIEAMKIFNEIKAEQSGTIVAISAKTGSPVEFGQPLFRILPD